MNEQNNDHTDENIDNSTEKQLKVLTAAQKEYWINSAADNLETAKIMLNTKQFLWAGYMCNLVAEKILKAVLANKFNIFPPKIHNLLTLAERGGLNSDLNQEQIDLLTALQPFQIEARYPSYKNENYKKLNLQFCTDIYTKTEDLFLWIKKKL
jgi:HEPN domain-containing protein